ncbi:MAG TPA: hypothetical protein VIM02_07245 [Rhizomicrobium sp.]|jgi:hypothetical protein
MVVTWTDLARAAFVTVLSTQRTNGLWFRPTNAFDAKFTFAPPGTDEYKLRSDEAFGYGSITMTWWALKSLTSTIVLQPTFLGSVIDAVQSYRAQNGAYGTPTGGWQAARKVNESARHTAMGILLLFEFGSRLDPRPSPELFEQSADWLLNTSFPEGGWPYQESNRADGPEPMSTASAIRALWEYRNTYRTTKAAGKLAEIDTKVKLALNWLVSSMKGGRWQTVHPEFDTVDTCFILELLCIANSQKPFQDEQLTSSDLVGELVRRFLESRRDGIWTDNAERTEFTIYSAVSALCFLSQWVPRSQFNPDDLEFQIRKRIEEKAVTDFMGTWDWCALLRLASTRSASAETVINYGQLFDEVQGVRRLARAGKLTRADASFAPRLCQDAMLYSLSHGDLPGIPSGRWELRYRRLPWWFQFILIPLLIALIAELSMRL